MGQCLRAGRGDGSRTARGKRPHEIGATARGDHGGSFQIGGKPHPALPNAIDEMVRWLNSIDPKDFQELGRRVPLDARVLEIVV